MLIGMYSIDMETYIHNKTYASMFIVVLFVIVPNWKQQEDFQWLKDAMPCGDSHQGYYSSV